MPTINIQISDVKQVKNNVSFTATIGNKIISRTLNINDVDNWSDFAAWLITQEPDFELLPEKHKSLEITFHTETVTDPLSGEDVIIKVLDDVIVT